MRRWVVTGGVGFIGYHLTRALIARGDSVVVIDDFSDAPYPRASKERNAEDLAREASGALEIVRACITDAAAVERATRGANGVVHLAGLAGVRPSFHDPARYAKVNVEGTAVVVEAAARAGVRTLAIASSSSVYGNSTPLPANEDAPAVEPESPYAASKRGAELVARTISRRVPALPIASLRFFTVYGPRQRPEMAITSFARACLEGSVIPVFGDGSMRRDFTHVDDIVRGVLAATDRERAGYRAYNLGSGAPVRLDALVDAIAEAVGRAARTERHTVPLGDVDATFADIERAKTELGWSPAVALVDGLKTVVDWVKSGR